MLAYNFLGNDRNIVTVELFKFDRVDENYEFVYSATVKVEASWSKVLLCNNKNVPEEDLQECAKTVHYKYCDIIKHESVVTGRMVDDDNSMIGLNVYDLYTFDYQFVKENEYEKYFKEYDVRNCELSDDGLVIKEDIDSLDLFNKDGYNLKDGLTAGEIICKYVDEDLETVIFRICNRLVGFE